MNEERVVRRRMTTVAMWVALAAAIAVPATAWALGASVEVSFEVRPSIGVAVSDDGLTVRSNTPWVLTTTSTQPGRTTVRRALEGSNTGVEGLAVPVAGLLSYSLVGDR